MSHRIYLYNVNSEEKRERPEPDEDNPLEAVLPVIGFNDNKVVMMMEWGYEFPMFLHPLFAGEPYLAAPLYNGTTGGIYADGFSGKAALVSFYSFIDRHADVLTDDPDRFRASKKKIYDFLTDKAVYNRFHLDAWDVFNMSDEPHEEQAAELLSLIRETNDCIKAAIEADDPSLLDECPDVQDNPYNFTSFRQLFSNSAYGYGWEVIRSGYFEEEEDETAQKSFTENGLKGLKQKNGTVIIPAQYDEVFSFPDNEAFAVVKRDGKFGYVNREGQMVTGLIYDDAYDCLNGFAIVQTGSLQYLVQPGTAFSTTGYDDVRLILEQPQWYAVGKGDAYSVINTAGQALLPFEFQSDITVQFAGDMPLLAAKHVSGVLHFYSAELTRIGNDSVSEVEWMGTFNGSPMLRITDEVQKGKKRQQFHGLVTAAGQTLLAVGYKDIRPAHDDVVIVRAEKKYGLFSASKGWLFEMEFDRIDLFLANVFTIEKNNMQGLYISGQKTVPPIFQIIITDVNWLADEKWETFATNENGAFRISYQGDVSALTPEELAVILGADNRYRYSPEELQHLTSCAGDALPADMLYQKGFEAFDSQDYKEALHYYQLAAAKGSGDAMNDLGYFYEVAEGYIDEKKSFEWYARGVEAGSPHAANGLANCYLNGTGTAADVSKAVALYEQSAEKHVPHAHYNLGVLYYEGVLVEKDDEKALKYFTYANRMGYECHNYVGVLLENTGDHKNAFKAYKDGLKNNDPDCAFNLARLHELGHGCKADPRKSLDFYMKAVAWGAIDAHLQLRRLYLHNELVRDEAKAREHEQLARDAGIEVPE